MARQDFKTKSLIYLMLVFITTLAIAFGVTDNVAHAVENPGYAQDNNIQFNWWYIQDENNSA